MSETEKKRRRIVQLSAYAVPQSGGDFADGCYALCDDGTLWRFACDYLAHGQAEGSWEQVPPIPQWRSETTNE